MSNEEMGWATLVLFIVLIASLIGYAIQSNYAHERYLVEQGFEQVRIPHDYVTIWVKPKVQCLKLETE